MFSPAKDGFAAEDVVARVRRLSTPHDKAQMPSADVLPIPSGGSRDKAQNRNDKDAVRGFGFVWHDPEGSRHIFRF